MTNAALIAAAFHQGPIFRQGFDAHIRTWRAEVQERVWALYHTDRQFRAVYDARRRLNNARTERFFGKHPLRSAA